MGLANPQEVCHRDNDCSSQSNACTGNKRKAIPTPVFGLIGAGMSVLLPASGRQEGSLSLELAEAGFTLRLPSSHPLGLRSGERDVQAARLVHSE